MKRLIIVLMLFVGVLIAQDISNIQLDGESRQKLQEVLDTLETEVADAAGTNALDDSIVNLQSATNSLQARANPFFWNNTNSKSSFVIWTSRGTTASGITTYIATNSSGTAIFANVYSIQCTAYLSTNVAGSIPNASLKSLIGTTSFVVNVRTNAASFAADGTTNYITVFGD